MITGEGKHAGHLHITTERDAEGRKRVEQQVHMVAGGDDAPASHDATSAILLERKDGRYVPRSYRYQDGRHECAVEFANGRMKASGDAAHHDGDAYPDDVMPSYAVPMLASCIFNQPGSKLVFTPMTDGDASFGKGGCRLVSNGQVEIDGERLWEVQWLNAAGTRVQAFYFDDTATLKRADWGGAVGRMVERESLARVQ